MTLLFLTHLTWMTTAYLLSIDRYDARLLLDHLPATHLSSNVTTAARPLSPSVSDSGWSDLPSDTEDTFFLSPAEIEDYVRAKRRAALVRDRDARLRALAEDDPEPPAKPENVWGGSDEEVSPRLF